MVGLDAISIEKVGQRSGTWTKGIERQTTSTEGVGHTQKRFVEQMNLPFVFACRQWIGVDSFPLGFFPLFLFDRRANDVLGANWPRESDFVISQSSAVEHIQFDGVPRSFSYCNS